MRFPRAGRRPASRPSVRPCLECLEARDVPTATATSLVATPNPAALGQTVTLTATVTGGDFAGGSDVFVTDSVTFFDGATKLGTVTPKATGGANHESRAQLTTAALGAGPHSLTARYSGGFDPIMLLFNDVSTSAAVSEVVNTPPPPPPATPADVTGQVSVARAGHGHPGNPLRQQLTLRNVGGGTISGPIYLVLDGLAHRVRLKNAAGSAGHVRPGDPFVTANVSLLPGGEISLTLLFANPRHRPLHFSTAVYAGAGAV